MGNWWHNEGRCISGVSGGFLLGVIAAFGVAQGFATEVRFLLLVIGATGGSLTGAAASCAGVGR